MRMLYSLKFLLLNVLPFLLYEVVGQIPAQGDTFLVLPVHVRHLAAQVETPALRELQEAGNIVIMMVIPGDRDWLQLQLQGLCDPLAPIDRAQLELNVSHLLVKLYSILTTRNKNVSNCFSLTPILLSSY